MNISSRNTLGGRPWRSLLGFALALAMGPAMAEGWYFRTGLVMVNPKSDNGTLAGTLNVDVDNNTQLGLIFGLRTSEHWAIDVLAATPFRQTATLNGARAVDFRHLPPTVTLQYHFAPEASIQPFFGLGLNYTLVYDEKETGPVAGARVELDNSFGLSAQAGVIFKLTDPWELVADVRWIDIDADASLNGADIGTVAVDPLVFGLNLGYKF